MEDFITIADGLKEKLDTPLIRRWRATFVFKGGAKHVVDGLTELNVEKNSHGITKVSWKFAEEARDGIYFIDLGEIAMLTAEEYFL